MVQVELAELAVSFWEGFITSLPSLVQAIIWVVIGLLLGKLLGRVANEILTRLKIDKRISTSAHFKLKLSNLSDVIIRWVIYLVFIQQATEILGVGVITTFVGDIVGAVPSFIGAGIIVLAAYIVGIYFKDHIMSSHSMYSDLAGKIIFFLTLYLGISVALRVIEIPILIVDQILLLLVASLALGMALALGLGLKDVVRDVSRGYVSKHGSRKK